MRSYPPAAVLLSRSELVFHSAACLTAMVFLLIAAVGAEAQETPPANIKISVSPSVVQAVNGKLPTSIPIAVSTESCTNFIGYDLMIAAPGLSITSVAAGQCIITGTLTIDPNTPAGKYKIVLLDPKKVPSGGTDFSVLEANAGPIPSGVTPQVDVLWEVLAQKVCNDVFGKRVAEYFYCIELKIGNNSGHPLQLAGVGFAPHIERLGIDNPGILLANTSYASTRAVLLRETVLSPRNIFYHSVQATGLVMAGFIPFFHVANAAAHYATGTSIVSGPLLQAINIAGPDRVVNQLNNLDDESFRDNQIVPNNTQVRTMVFVEKRAVTDLLDGANVLGLDNTTGESSERSADVPSDSSARKKQKTASNVQLRSSQGEAQKELANTRLNSKQKDKSKLAFFKTGDFSPLLVKLALGKPVVVGELIEYLERVQIQGASAGVASALSLNPTRVDFGNQAVGSPSGTQTVTVTNASTTAVSGITVNLSGTNQADFSQANGCTTLAPGANCTISVTFTPASQGPRAATLNVSYTGGSPVSAAVSGTGTQGSVGVSVTPSPVPAFAAQKLQTTSSAQVITVTNTGSNALTGLSVSVSGLNAADFSQTNTCGTSLNSAAKCTISVTFTPLATGPRMANLIVSYTLAGSPQTQSLQVSGTGQ